MNIEKQIITDLFEILRSQHRVLTFLVSNDEGLVATLANSSSIPHFADAFHNHQTYALAHPKGQLGEALGELERMLDAIGERLKKNTGGWDN
jgi:hypothetical protein